MAEDRVVESKKGRVIFAAAVLFLLALILAGIIAWRLRGLHRAPGSTKVDAAKTIRIGAYIDGRSRMRIQGNSVQWLHQEWAAPGKHGGLNKPTVINGKEWFPEWPDLSDNETRQKVESNKYEELDPPLPKRAMDVKIKKIKARGTMRVIQQPTAGNEYTLVIEFDDGRDGGAADYVVEVVYSEN